MLELVDKWEGIPQGPSQYNLKLFADKETYEKVDAIAKLQDKSAQQLAMEIIRNFVASNQNGKIEWDAMESIKLIFLLCIASVVATFFLLFLFFVENKVTLSPTLEAVVLELRLGLVLVLVCGCVLREIIRGGSLNFQILFRWEVVRSLSMKVELASLLSLAGFLWLFRILA